MALPLCLRTAKTGCRAIQNWHSSPRLMSSTSNIIVDMDTTKGVATMKMNKKPVNSLNLEFMQELTENIDKLEKDPGCRGLILTSQNPGIFSAGLDIMEMYQPNIDRLRQFWSSLQELWIRLYGSNLVVMSAINGHAPAGGCLLSICSDYRVMASGKFTIGLNETLLGIVAPFWFMHTMKNTVGQRETEWALQRGHLYSGEEALKVGLIDQLTPPEDVLTATQTEMDSWLKIPDNARQLSKLLVRQQTLDQLIPVRKQDVDNFVNFCTKDSIQKSLGMYLAAMKKKSEKK